MTYALLWMMPRISFKTRPSLRILGESNILMETQNRKILWLEPTSNIKLDHYYQRQVKIVDRSVRQWSLMTTKWKEVHWGEPHHQGAPHEVLPSGLNYGHRRLHGLSPLLSGHKQKSNGRSSRRQRNLIHVPLRGKSSTPTILINQS